MRNATDSKYGKHVSSDSLDMTSLKYFKRGA